MCPVDVQHAWVLLHRDPSGYRKPRKGMEFNFRIQGLKKVWNLVEIYVWVWKSDFRSGKMGKYAYTIF